MTSVESSPRVSTDGVRRLLQPRSVAIVGLSTDSSKHGGRVLRHLRALGYAGDIFGVHPKADAIDGVEIFRSVSDLPVPVDALVCAVPAPALPGVIAEGAALGAGSAVIFGAGFAEAGGEGRSRQQELVEAAGSSGLRILGPNSAGMVRASSRVALSFLTSLDRPGNEIRPGPVAVVTQSGGAGSYLVNRAAARGAGLAAVVSTGNEADITAETVIQTLVEDDEVRAVALVLEAVRDGARFIAAIEAAHAAGKPVVVCKLGTSAAGREVMRTHTGALADERRVTAGVLDSLGVTVAKTPGELLDVAEVLARTRAPAGPTVGVVTHSGGNAVLLADLAAEEALELPPVPPDLADELAEYINHGAAGNPMDLGAIMSGPHRFGEVVARTAGVYDMVLAVSTPHPPSFARQRGESLAALADSPAPVINLWLAGDLGEEGLEVLRSAGVPVVTEPRAAAKALRALVAWHAWDAVAGSSQALAGGAGSPTLDGLTAPPTEAQAKAVLADWGIPAVRGAVARDAGEAAAAAEDLGFPVVVKISAAGLEHKTELGGVRLNLRTADEVRRAVDEMLSAVAGSGVDVEGVLVEQFRPGLEMIVGARHDDTFGPVVLVGLGGVLAEAMEDVVVAPAPVSVTGARRMLDRLRNVAVLRSSRSGPPPHVDALAEVIATFSASFGASDRIAEAEINPLVFSADGWVALDAVIRLR